MTRSSGPASDIEWLVEPRPVSHAAEVDPDGYAELSREPRGFIAFRLVPRPAET